jgi:beta-1,4-mannosyl-glycoprotein beta-1,4-N-acetylglucosaminyltransferase
VLHIVPGALGKNREMKSKIDGRRIYDCFCYLNEDMILELRLETLWEHVDFFVICEATYTQSGKPKPLNFSIERFGRYRDKIRYLALEHLPPGPLDFWKNENYQRNYLVNGLGDARADDLIMISDLDEIPRPEAIALYDPAFLRGDFEQRYYSYFLNNMWSGGDGTGFWYGSKITTYRHFKEFFNSNATSVRAYKSFGVLRSIKRLWFRRFAVQVIREGGWHFTWILTPAGIIEKIESMAHQEFNLPQYKDPATIAQVIRDGRDLLRPGIRFRAQALDTRLPQAVISNPSRYRAWLLPPEGGAGP